MKVGDGTNTWSGLSFAYPTAPVTTTAILAASSWSNKSYSFEGTYPNAEYDLSISINGDSCTSEQCKAWDLAIIKGSPTTNKIKAMGTIPTIDIPIVITYRKK